MPSGGRVFGGYYFSTIQLDQPFFHSITPDVKTLLALSTHEVFFFVFSLLFFSHKGFFFVLL